MPVIWEPTYLDDPDRVILWSWFTVPREMENTRIHEASRSYMHSNVRKSSGIDKVLNSHSHKRIAETIKLKIQNKV